MPELLSPALPDSKSVFVNCPFDEAYSRLFGAIVFATVCCGFRPTCALATGDVAQPRIERVANSLFASRYSIHDLSRCTGEGAENLARFNMPLELGMAMAHRFLGSPDDRHDWLVLVPTGYRHLRFVSDLAAYDLHLYDGSVEGVIRSVMQWLVTRPDAVPSVRPSVVLDALPAFEASLKALKDEWAGTAPWSHVVEAALDAKPA